MYGVGAMKKLVKRRGFTLLEVILTTTIITVVAAIGGPPLVHTFRQRVTQGAAQRFVGAHMLARSTAVRYGRVAELHIDPSGARFWVEVDTSRVGGLSDTVGYVHNIDRITMTSTRSLICFDGRGLATTRGACESADITITFEMSGRADTVRTTALGKVLR